MGFHLFLVGYQMLILTKKQKMNQKIKVQDLAAGKGNSPDLDNEKTLAKNLKLGKLITFSYSACILLMMKV